MGCVKYEHDRKTAWFNGMKFCRDDDTGYYLNSNHRLRLHRAVWSFFHGTIPKGFHVHHKDEDKSNNELCNLELKTQFAHLSLHGHIMDFVDHEAMVERMNHARESASKWHRSSAGREWHRKHSQGCKSVTEQIKKSCDYCGKIFKTNILNSRRSRFCSNKCKSAWRRKEGIDNVQRICECCGIKFTVNKYSKQKYCSKKCVGEMRHKNRKGKSD